MVCHGCGGSGYNKVKLFTERKRLKGIKTVWINSTSWLVGRSERSRESITAKEFYEKVYAP